MGGHGGARMGIWDGGMVFWGWGDGDGAVVGGEIHIVLGKTVIKRCIRIANVTLAN